MKLLHKNDKGRAVMRIKSVDVRNYLDNGPGNIVKKFEARGVFVEPQDIKIENIIGFCAVADYWVKL